MNTITRTCMAMAMATMGLTASAALEPVSITPNGGVLPVGTDIKIQFPSAIDWADGLYYDDNDIQLISLDSENEGELYMAFDGATYISGDVLHVKFTDASYLDGVTDWSLYVPAGTVVNDEGETNAAIFVNYVEPDAVTIEFVDPTYDATEIEAFHQPLQVRVDPADAEYTGSFASGEDADLDSVGQVVWTGLDGKTSVYPVFFTENSTEGVWNMNIYLMGVNETTPGTYVLTVNAGTFRSGSLENAEFTHTWTIADNSTAPGDEDIEPQVVLPYDEEQEAPFTTIQIAFPYNDGNVTYDGSVNPITVVYDATGELMPIEVSTNSNMVRITMDLNVNGEYTLTVPAGVLRNNKGKNVEIVRHYSVYNGETGIETLVNDTDARYFNLQGVEVAAPAPGQLLIRVSNGRADKLRF